MKEILVNKRYRVDRRIGAGGFGLVYAGIDTETEEEVAIKLTLIRDGSEALQYEAETYDALSGGVGIPRVWWFGPEGDFYVLVHELLGPSLEDLFNYCDRKFSLKTVLLVAEQAIHRIKHIHNKGYLHCDIKPDNFLLGVGNNGNILYTIDFGLARNMDAAKGHGIRDDRPFGGTARYASLNNHKGLEQSRGDDLESLGYVLLYFARGSLPWQGLKPSTDEERTELIKQKKMSTTIDDLCKGLPDEFATYLRYTRSLQPIKKPDYAYLLGLFHNLFVAQGFQYNNVFDWTEKLYHELQSTSSTDET
ncbi:casein kinase I isoform delta [Pochonia chlamydosporia 170]|uniref:non-specific serine/threonine protein kinase n=1 Tax=Pochonia chlamydosporia 170 TaxID=1380566 RepID=A0A179F2T5_METCM|nr:casein kinase I isoform delta [Pochonia chlamydosporia 170]OAQ59463.1 casein kinase I isoform delta [Pochonia chlamydosporia 170]